MDKEYLISVITPFHNTAPKLFMASFESVKKQTIGFKNIEYVIVIHNCSEESRTLAEKMAAGYDNVKTYVLNNEFHTPSSPRNYGLKQASGKYIAFLDSDDAFYPHALAEAAKAITEENADLCMFRFDTSNDGNNSVFEVRQYSLLNQTDARIVLENGRYDQRKLIAGMNMTVHTKLYDGAFIRNNSLYFDDNVSFAEDGLYNLTALALANKIVVLPQLIGYQYYQNNGSTMQSFKRNEEDLWQLCLSITKIAETGWKYGLYVDAYITEASAITGGYILCSDVRYSFLKKANKLVAPYLKMCRPLETTKIDRKKNLRTFRLINALVYTHPLLAASAKWILRVLHINLEKIIKESVWI